MKHPHAELMKQYAEDAMETDKPWERWEYSCDGSPWGNLYGEIGFFLTPTIVVNKNQRKYYLLLVHLCG